MTKDIEEERDNYSIVNLIEYISLRDDLSIFKLTQQSPAAHIWRGKGGSVQGDNFVN